jgi:hypothetical protein
MDHPTKKKKPQPVSSDHAPIPHQDPRSLGDLSGGGTPHDRGFSMNLMPSAILPENDLHHRLIQLGWVAIVTMLGMGVLYVGLLVIESQLTNEGELLIQQLQSVEQEIAAKQEVEEDAALIQGTLKDAELLLNHHIYWTQIFSLLEDLTLPDVSYVSLSGDTTGTLSLRAQAKDFAMIADQVRVFQEATDRIAAVSVTSGSVQAMSVGATPSEEEGLADETEPSVPTIDLVEFDLSLTVTPSVLLESVNASL